jgi:hypothetical protein
LLNTVDSVGNRASIAGEIGSINNYSPILETSIEDGLNSCDTWYNRCKLEGAANRVIALCFFRSFKEDNELSPLTTCLIRIHMIDSTSDLTGACGLNITINAALSATKRQLYWVVSNLGSKVASLDSQ